MPSKQELSSVILQLANELNLKQLGNINFSNITIDQIDRRYSYEQKKKIHQKLLEHQQNYGRAKDDRKKYVRSNQTKSKANPETFEKERYKKVNKTKEALINRIVHLCQLHNIESIEGYEDIDFINASDSNFSHLDTTELEGLIQILALESGRKDQKEKLVSEIGNKISQIDINNINDYKDFEWTIAQLVKKDFKELTYMNGLLIEEEKSQVIRSRILTTAKLHDIKEVEAFKGLPPLAISKADVNELSIQDLQTVERYIKSQLSNTEVQVSHIFTLVEEMEISYIDDYDIDFTVLKPRELRENYSSDDREFLIQQLEQLQAKGFHKSHESGHINPFELLDKYKHGSIDEDKLDSPTQNDDLWRENIPHVIRRQVANYKTLSMNDFYEQTKHLIFTYKGKDSTEVKQYLSDLSQLVFADDSVEDTDEKRQEDEEDGINASIYSIIEMIMLPYHELLKQIQERGGDIVLANVWLEPFTEKLKQEVKERDDWRCIVCEAESSLHVHHKIPRAKGGPNHKDNLVTLCASCHAVIEQNDLQRAYKKCLRNYKVNKNRGTSNHFKKVDKTQLRSEVEEQLDQLYLRLDNKNEGDMAKTVLEVMQRLEVIFYE